MDAEYTYQHIIFLSVESVKIRVIRGDKYVQSSQGEIAGLCSQ